MLMLHFWSISGYHFSVIRVTNWCITLKPACRWVQSYLFDNQLCRLISKVFALFQQVERDGLRTCRQSFRGPAGRGDSTSGSTSAFAGSPLRFRGEAQSLSLRRLRKSHEGLDPVRGAHEQQVRDSLCRCLMTLTHFI